jgi:hypothetical protein
VFEGCTGIFWFIEFSFLLLLLQLPHFLTYFSWMFVCFTHRRNLLPQPISGSDYYNQIIPCISSEGILDFMFSMLNVPRSPAWIFVLNPPLWLDWIFVLSRLTILVWALTRIIIIGKNIKFWRVIYESLSRVSRLELEVGKLSHNFG